MWLSWVLCLGPHQASIKVSAGTAVSSEFKWGRIHFQAYLCYWQNAYLELVELRASVRVFFCFSFSACQPEIAYILVVWGPLMWPHTSSKPVRSGVRGG